MARGEKKKVNPQSNPVAEERNRLKKVAISNNILSSDGPAKVSSSISASTSSSVVALGPSKTVAKHHGRDILKKSQRKNKFLFSFPGLLAPLSGGKIGELKDLGTKNPILYLDFPKGQMKLFGTIIFPKNRYLTLQFSKGGKNVMCEDNFDTMIVFSEAWWIGNKDENPEEVRLEFPKEMNMKQHTEYDFKGGAGTACERKLTFKKPGSELVDHQMSKTELTDALSDSSNELEDPTQLNPSQHSARTAKKSYKFAEASSGDDSVEDMTTTSDGKEHIIDRDYSKKQYTPGKIDDSGPIAYDIDNADDVKHTSIVEQVQQTAMSASKSKDLSGSNKSSLVQATISTLFKKVEEKKVPAKKKEHSSSKDSGKILRHTNRKRKIDQVQVGGPSKKAKVSEEKLAGTKSTAKKIKFADEDDDIEEFSSSSQDTIGSDDDWTV